MNAPLNNLERAQIFIRVLQANDVEYFFLSPGFRNSPLNLALESLAPEKTIRILDERAAAFAALGRTRASGRPSAVICTSGTAAANFFPAVLEAEHSHVPLIAVTADRPQELVGTGANQTMDQNRLFGAHVRDFVNIPADAAEAKLPLLWGAVARACGAAKRDGGGPVQVNFCFAEPLLPAPENFQTNPVLTQDLPRAEPQNAQVDASALEKIRSELARSADLRPAFLLGSFCFAEKVLQPILTLARDCQIPIFAEPASGVLGCGKFSEESSIFSHFDFLENLPPHAWPNLVFRFGPPPIHKSVEAKLFEHCGAGRYFVFDFANERRFPLAANARFLPCDQENWASAAAQILADLDFPRAKDAALALTEMNNFSLAEIRNRLEKVSGFSEWACWQSLLDNLPEGADVFLGNSMPIRDFNRLAAKFVGRYRVFHNRGLSGIDGLIATAIGANLDRDRRLILVLGDLSALYDLNALLIARDYAARLDLWVVVINNNGGEIFRMVDTKNYPEKLFVLPNNPALAPLAQALGLPSQTVHSSAELVKAFEAESIGHPRVRVIECRIDREANQQVRRQ